MMIGQPFKIRILWYDKVPEPEINKEYEGEILSWLGTQVTVRVKGYSVLRFWKRTGMEVGNKDWVRRGFFLAVEQLNPDGSEPIQKPGIAVNMEAES